ncbi:hypothetical protein HII12_000115 [Brettanomyces bruxellensis]|uniref:Mitochondrial phosphate carrier protein n=1 Tax=Dekkera bruxellensis TaxID=5007 RepID=A0A8H6BT53_DEKBR|nr:hypothetical protein HII12_000115 [Brettanomyces bruxellensis]
MSSDHIELYSRKYYSTCALGGFSLCRLQVDKTLYKGNLDGIKTIAKKEGARALYSGFLPTFIGYGLQGTGKYGFYEVFKKKFSDYTGHTGVGVYLASSACAEFLADLALCPFEAMKVKIQTTLPPATPKNLYKGLYSGLVPLWFRQIPYTMVKFTTFEKISQYNKLQQTGVSFLGGYIAGIFCAVISHPADVLVSKINNDTRPGESLGQAVGRHYKKMGFKGLWNGLGIRIVMIGTLTGCQWLLYDSFKLMSGLPTTGN